MNKHTPGPWMLSLSGPTVYALHGETLRNRFSATAQGGQSDDAGPDELRANAVLMRAAPDLLEGLTQLMRNFPTDYDMAAAGWDRTDIDKACAAHDFARAVFAKATGEAQ